MVTNARICLDVETVQPLNTFLNTNIKLYYSFDRQYGHGIIFNYFLKVKLQSDYNSSNINIANMKIGK